MTFADLLQPPVPSHYGRRTHRSKAQDLPDPIGFTDPDAVSKVSFAMSLSSISHQSSPSFIQLPPSSVFLSCYFAVFTTFDERTETIQEQNSIFCIGSGTACGSSSAKDGQGVGTCVLACQVVAHECDHAVHERIRRSDFQHDGGGDAHHRTFEGHLDDEQW